MNETKLKKILDQSIKEAHFVGLQSGKKETSGLVKDVLIKMEPLIKENMEPYQQESKEWRDKADVKLDKIDSKVSVTNGRVSKLEFWITAIKWLCGTVILALGIALPTIRHWILQDIQRIQTQQISEAVSKALSETLPDYEFKVDK